MSRVTCLVVLKVLPVPAMAQVAPLCGDGFGLTSHFLDQWMEKQGDAVGCWCPQALPICRGTQDRDVAGAEDRHSGMRLAQALQQGRGLSAKALHLKK